MVACQGRGVVAATHAGVVSSDDAQGIRRVLAMTDDELKAIEARAHAATPGPWEGFDGYVLVPSVGAVEFVTDNPSFGDSSNDTEFIASARTDVPALVAEVRRLQDVVQVARGALADIADMTPREIADGVAQRKALRVYAETGLPKPMK
jgi:hypothetical protein